MIRVYLDWNVLASLRGTIEIESANELQILIEQNKNNLLLPFSSVHIQDLLKGADDPKNIPMIQRDLDHINSVTGMNYIEYDIVSNRLYPRIADAHQIFENAYETKNEPLFNADSLLASFSELGFPEMAESLLNVWRNSPTEIDFAKLDQQTRQNESFKIFLPRTRIENNMLSLMLDLNDFYTDIKSNPEVYKNLAQSLREMLKTDPKVISNSTDPISVINSILKALNPEFDFDTLGGIKTFENNKYLSSSLVQFAIELGNLDLIGYHPDSLNKKNTYTNFSNDTHHAYYAGSCHYFVTNESKLIEKANVLYRKYKIDCIALKPHQFVNEIMPKLKEEYTLDSFIASINDTIENHWRKELSDHGYEGGTLHLYDPVSRILGYFNYLYTIEYDDTRRTIILRSLNNLFSGFSFYTEMKSIFNKFHSMLGPDIYDRDEPNDSDFHDRNNSDSLERAWIINKYFCILSLEEGSTQFRFEMNKLTEDFLKSIT